MFLNIDGDFICTIHKIMSFGWVIADIIKASKTWSPINFMNLWGVQRTLFLAIRNLENSKTPKTLQHFDVLGICISFRRTILGVRAYSYISAWASVLLVRVKGNSRASNSGTAIVQSRFFLYYTYWNQYISRQ